MFYNIISNISKVVVKSLFKVEIMGKENIPLEGGCILAPNHKSNWDAVMIIGLLSNRKMYTLAKKELFKNPILERIFENMGAIPVDREKPELSTIKTVLKHLKNNEVVTIFPEGTRHKDLETFAEVKAGVGLFTLKSKAPVIPISIVTNYKLFSKLTIIIGNPMSFESYHSKKVVSEDYMRVSQEVMDEVKTNYLKHYRK